MFVPLVMTETEESEYNQMDRGDDSVLENLDIVLNVNSDKSLTSFYNGVRQFSDTLGNYKIDFIIDRIKKPQTTGQFIIYTTYIINGLNRIKKELAANEITYATISGSESNDKKEDAKNKYNNGDVKVLLITKAGTEGIDTVNTEAVFIYEGATFNNALIEQAIARAVRYKSHYNLPKNQQKVFVYRLLIVKESDVDLINKINKNIIKNFSLINKKYAESSKKISLLKHEAEINDDINDYVVNNKNVPSDISKSLREKIDFEKSKYKSLSPPKRKNI
jgi:superfamily II DNA/RNA helicase